MLQYSLRSTPKCYENSSPLTNWRLNPNLSLLPKVIVGMASNLIFGTKFQGLPNLISLLRGSPLSGFLWWLSQLKNPSAMQETWVWSLDREDPLGEEMATNSNILAWKFSWTEEPGRLQSMGLQRVGHCWAHTHTTTQQQDGYDKKENIKCWQGCREIVIHFIR